MLIDIKNLTAGQQEELRAKQNLTVDDLLKISSHRISASADPNDVLRSIESRHAEKSVLGLAELKNLMRQYDAALADHKAVEKTESTIATDDKGQALHRESLKRSYSKVSVLQERLRRALADAREAGVKIDSLKAISLSAEGDDDSALNAVDAYDAAKMRERCHLPLSADDELILGLSADSDFAAARASRNAQLSARGFDPKSEQADPAEVKWLRQHLGLPAA